MQALDAPTLRQTVADEIHTPGLIGTLGNLQRLASQSWALGLLPLPNRKVGLAEEPIDHSGQSWSKSPRVSLVELAPYPEDHVQGVHVQMRLYQQ